MYSKKTMSREFDKVATLILAIIGIDSTFQELVLLLIADYRSQINRLAGRAPEEQADKSVEINSTAFEELAKLCFQLYPEITAPSLDDIQTQLVSILSDVTLEAAYQVRLDGYAKLWIDASVETLTTRKAQQEESIIKDATNILSLQAKMRSMRPRDYYDKNLFDKDLQKKICELDVLEKRSKLAKEVVLKCKGLLIERA
jgi:hypothetical protein